MLSTFNCPGGDTVHLRPCRRAVLAVPYLSCWDVQHAQSFSALSCSPSVVLTVRRAGPVLTVLLTVRRAGLVLTVLLAVRRTDSR
jgi:hypothetical protein